VSACVCVHVRSYCVIVRLCLYIYICVNTYIYICIQIYICIHSICCSSRLVALVCLRHSTREKNTDM